MPRDRDYDDQKDEPTKRLDQDYDSPFSPPADVKASKSPFGPDKDINPDQQELYDEGADDASLDNGPNGERGSGPRPKKLF